MPQNLLSELDAHIALSISRLDLIFVHEIWHAIKDKLHGSYQIFKLSNC